MDNKKPLLKQGVDVTDKPLGKEPSKLANRRDYRRSGKKCKVELYREGMRLVAPSSGFMGQPAHLKGVERGQVKGWSAQSRKRMREWLLTHAVSKNHLAYAVTFTVPGPPLKKDEWERLWHSFSVALRRVKGGAVWRKEVQSRNSVHWHCLIVLPAPHEICLTSLNSAIPVFDGKSYEKVLKAGKQPTRFYTENQQLSDAFKILRDGEHPFNICTIYDLWINALDSLGACTHRYKSGEVVHNILRSWLVGGNRYSVEVVPMDKGQEGWNRYMLDHTTKAKQEQIAEHMGRHWGVINRKLFEELEPAIVKEMTWPEYCRFLRAYNRLITPYVRLDGALFGRVKGRSFRRGMYGKYVAFSNPETGLRMALYAQGVIEAKDHDSSIKKL